MWSMVAPDLDDLAPRMGSADPNSLFRTHPYIVALEMGDVSPNVPKILEELILTYSNSTNLQINAKIIKITRNYN